MPRTSYLQQVARQGIGDRSDLHPPHPLLARWQTRPHVARWWRDPCDLASITAEYLPCIDGRDPTEIFVIELDGPRERTVRVQALSSA